MHTKITIEVDGRPHETHEHSLTGRQIKDLAQRDEGTVYRLEDGDGRHHVSDHEAIPLHEGECFIIEHGHHRQHEHEVAIEVDGTRYEAPQRVMTGASIKALAHKPPANTLYLVEIRDGRPFRREIGDTETVHLHSGERFVTHPPVGKTS